MSIDLARLFGDPALYFHGYEGDHVRFLPMDRDSYERSIFLDRRIQIAPGQAYRVPLQPLLGHLAAQGFSAPRLNLIHHVGQCGSTLLARALDVTDRSLVLREPFHLRQVAVHGGAGFTSAYASGEWRAMLGLSLHMLGKRFDPAQPVIVKGNVPISMIGDAILEADPDRAAILLYFPLVDYCAAVLRTPNHLGWVQSVTRELRLAEDPLVGPIDGLDPGALVGALWFSLIKRYERILSQNGAARSLDANQLFDEPQATVAASARLFEVALSEEEIAERVSGPLFSSYAKDPSQAYAPEQRVERREAWKQDNAVLIDSARRWVGEAASRHGLPAALERPLLGDPAPLL
ncbi:hypothetical protein GCM10022280_20670 [Sphingomonas swuensis]|uniref:Sulfotransferase n=1 Tax=Sphingomonas swuensis TaxID=977800 RepID=A0ABP7T300_9SPHN